MRGVIGYAVAAMRGPEHLEHLECGLCSLMYEHESARPEPPTDLFFFECRRDTDTTAQSARHRTRELWSHASASPAVRCSAAECTLRREG